MVLLLSLFTCYYYYYYCVAVTGGHPRQGSGRLGSTCKLPPPGASPGKPSVGRPPRAGSSGVVGPEADGCGGSDGGALRMCALSHEQLLSSLQDFVERQAEVLGRVQVCHELLVWWRRGRVYWSHVSWWCPTDSKTTAANFAMRVCVFADSLFLGE